MTPSATKRDEALYRYPNSNVLRNRLDIRDSQELERAGKMFVRLRMREELTTGRLDFDHICAIHHHLFQDVYDWAGQPRQVTFGKGETVFLPHGRIHTAMQYLHEQLADQNFLKHRSQTDFAREAAPIIGDLNYIHPFREGNGQTQLLYLKQLGHQAGHEIDLTRLDQRPWIEASIDTARADPNYDKMRWCIDRAIAPDRSREQERER